MLFNKLFKNKKQRVFEKHHPFQDNGDKITNLLFKQFIIIFVVYEFSDIGSKNTKTKKFEKYFFYDSFFHYFIINIQFHYLKYIFSTQ